MRKGYLLIEMIVFLAVLVLIAAPLDRFFRVFAYELPRGSRFVQESRALDNAVGHIRADVASAKWLSESVADSSQSASLLMETPDGEVSYSFSDGRILRIKAGAIEDSWPVPHCRIEWRIWQREKTGYAVELKTYIEDKDLGRTHKKMANNFLFFAGTPWETSK